MSNDKQISCENCGHVPHAGRCFVCGCEGWAILAEKAREEEERELKTSKRILEVLRVYKTFKVHPEIFHSADFDIDYNQIRLMTEKEMVSDHLADDFYTVDTIHTWPASPWQFFKDLHRESWWLGWLVRRRPVEYQQTIESGQIQVKRYLGYPDAVIPSSRLGRAIVFEQVDEVRG